MKNGNNKKVVVAMSGGVDSSVAAALLVQAGYDVIGVFMKNWSEPLDGYGVCPWVEDQKDVRAVCDKLNIPCYTFNFEKEYFDKVVKDFYSEYKMGRTPNPDVLCNKEVKFDVFLKKAKKLGASVIATGHYARLKLDKNGRQHLFKGVDKNKDQSYFLWMLGQEELIDVLFPVGGLKKSIVRKIALKYNLPNAKKKDSQGICFIGPVKVRQFLMREISPKAGPVMYNGAQIGEHEGVWFYTIGQKLGLSAVKWPTTDVPVLFVKDKDLKTNTLIAGLDDDLYANALICNNSRWVTIKPKMPILVEATIRYRHKVAPAMVEEIGDDLLKVSFSQSQRAITPGQSVVFYQGDELIGGAIINKVV